MKELEKLNKKANEIRLLIELKEMRQNPPLYSINELKKELEQLNLKIIKFLYKWKKIY